MKDYKLLISLIIVYLIIIFFCVRLNIQKEKAHEVVLVEMLNNVSTNYCHYKITYKSSIYNETTSSLVLLPCTIETGTYKLVRKNEK